MQTIPLTIRTRSGSTLIRCPSVAHHLVNALGKIGAVLDPDPVTVHERDGNVQVQLADGSVVQCSADADFFAETPGTVTPDPASPVPGVIEEAQDPTGPSASPEAPPPVNADEE